MTNRPNKLPVVVSYRKTVTCTSQNRSLGHLFFIARTISIETWSKYYNTVDFFASSFIRKKTTLGTALQRRFWNVPHHPSWLERSSYWIYVDDPTSQVMKSDRRADDSVFLLMGVFFFTTIETWNKKRIPNVLDHTSGWLFKSSVKHGREREDWNGGNWTATSVNFVGSSLQSMMRVDRAKHFWSRSHNAINRFRGNRHGFHWRGVSFVPFGKHKLIAIQRAC